MGWSIIWREPVLQFLGIGLATWVMATTFDGERDRYRIDIGSRQLSQITEAFERQFGARPSKDQLRHLTGRYIEDEIAYREGVAMGLARDDEIVRRRIVQKYEFLSSDQALPATPSNSELLSWYKAHEEQYRAPDRTSFVHIYFSSDRNGDQSARTRAQELAPKLTRDVLPPQYGDAFPGPSEANDLTAAEIVRIFGNSPVARIIQKLSVGHWVGPYRSAYGWHLVRATGRTPSVVPPLAQIRDKVLADYMDAERERLNKTNAAALRKRYVVSYEGEPI